jgi:YolD-like protein
VSCQGGVFLKINEGNIFEAMRLVLPEHRAVMNWVTKEMAKRERPILEEDEYNQMQYVLGEALAAHQRVRIQLFHPYEDVYLCGIPACKGNTLYLYTEGGQVVLPMHQIMSIETA